MRHLWNEYVAYLKDNPEGFWFKRKLYGWGWTPAKPAGWLVVVGYLLFMFGLVMYAEQTGCAEEDPTSFLVMITVVTLVFLVIVWRTGEPPKWQWGKHKQ